MKPIVIYHDVLVSTLDEYGEVSYHNVENALREIGVEFEDVEEWEVVEQL